MKSRGNIEQLTEVNRFSASVLSVFLPVFHHRVHAVALISAVAGERNKYVRSSSEAMKK